MNVLYNIEYNINDYVREPEDQRFMRKLYITTCRSVIKTTKDLYNAELLLEEKTNGK